MYFLQPDIDKVLPSMYKALKLIVAGLYGFSNEGLNDNIIADESLRDSINNTMHDVRAVLCHFNVRIFFYTFLIIFATYLF